MELHQVRLLVSGFAGALALVSAMYQIFDLKLVQQELLARDKEEIKDLKARITEHKTTADKLRSELDTANQRILELQGSSNAVQLRLQRTDDEIVHLREFYNLEKNQQESLLSNAKSELVITRDSVKQEASARKVAEKALIAEQSERQLRETSFPSLEAQALWENGRPSPQAYLLLEGGYNAQKIKEALDRDDSSPLQKARIVQALVEAKKHYAECLRLEREKHKAGLAMMGSDRPLSQRLSQMRLLEDEVMRCESELIERMNTADLLAKVTFAYPQLKITPADVIDYASEEPSPFRWLGELFYGRPKVMPHRVEEYKGPDPAIEGLKERSSIENSEDRLDALREKGGSGRKEAIP